jgi:hypothetical protein
MPLIFKLYVLSFLAPFIFGSITKTDVGPICIILAFLIVIIYAVPFRVSMIASTLIGVLGVIISCLSNADSFPFKEIMQFVGIFFILTSLRVFKRHLASLCKFLLVSFRILAVTYILTAFSPALSNLLSVITFVNRSVSSSTIRSATSFLGEPSFAAILFAGYIVISIAIRAGAPQLISKRSILADLALYISAALFTRSLTSVAVALAILSPFFIFAFFRYLLILRIPKAFLGFLIIIASACFILPQISFSPALTFSVRSIDLILKILSNSSIDILMSDTSVAQRFLNIHIFLANFPFSVDFITGSTFSQYERVAYETASSSYFDYSSLFLSAYPYYTAQVSAFPALYFKTGLIPSLSYAVLLFLYISSFATRYFSCPCKISAIILLIISLTAGVSLIFPLPYLVIFVVYSLDTQIDAQH